MRRANIHSMPVLESLNGTTYGLVCASDMIGLMKRLRSAKLPPHHRDPFDRLLIAQAMSEPVALRDGRQLVAGVSIGFAIYQAGMSASALCEQADAAMYQTKRGRHREPDTLAQQA